jgi:hypothetical protein
MATAAARRVPIMINIPFFGHIFVFSIMFGRAMENDGIMPRLAVHALALLGAAGVAGALML